MSDAILTLILLTILIALLVGGLGLLIKGSMDLVRLWSQPRQEPKQPHSENKPEEESTHVERAA